MPCEGVSLIKYFDKAKTTTSTAADYIVLKQLMIECNY